MFESLSKQFKFENYVIGRELHKNLLTCHFRVLLQREAGKKFQVEKNRFQVIINEKTYSGHYVPVSSKKDSFYLFIFCIIEVLDVVFIY
jgi:hypothetical protein